MKELLLPLHPAKTRRTAHRKARRLFMAEPSNGERIYLSVKCLYYKPIRIGPRRILGRPL